MRALPCARLHHSRPTARTLTALGELGVMPLVPRSLGRGSDFPTMELAAPPAEGKLRALEGRPPKCMLH